MLKTLSLLFVFLFLATSGSAYAQSSNQIFENEVSAEDMVLKTGTVPTEAVTFNTDIAMVNFNKDQEDKILRAAELIKKVVESEAFKKRVLNHTYNGKKQFANNEGLSNAEIYKKILAGAERLKPVQNNTMDLELELYTNLNTSTVGYTYPSTPRVWMNLKFFSKFTAAGVTANMMHEWLHKLGFEHDVENTAKRPHSVPYAVGYIVRQMAKKIK